MSSYCENCGVHEDLHDDLGNGNQDDCDMANFRADNVDRMTRLFASVVYGR